MIASALAAQTAPLAVVEGDALDVFGAIWSPECTLAICHRALDRGLLTWLDTLPPEKLPKARLSLPIAEVRGAVEALCEEKGILDEPSCAALVADIVALAQAYAKLMEADRVTLRLDVVDNNACRKFHQDNVEARLLCTYRGHGTQYGYGQQGETPDDVQALPLGAVGIFKGRLLPASGQTSVLHRSPPIEGTGETRLLLVIDESVCEDGCCS